MPQLFHVVAAYGYAIQLMPRWNAIKKASYSKALGLSADMYMRVSFIYPPSSQVFSIKKYSQKALNAASCANLSEYEYGNVFFSRPFDTMKRDPREFVAGRYFTVISMFYSLFYSVKYN